ncbi:MAG: DUF58 domain-containing protein [Actinomycetota bacterium]|nr:DUF58 domain-containing protein [Actinomycetota bacterium]
MRSGGGSRLSVWPTARGWQALVFGLLIMGAARLIGTTQFYQLAYALLAFLVAALVLGLLGSRGLDFSRSLPPGVRFTAGSSVRIDLLLSNDSRFDTSEITVTDRLPKPKSFEVPALRAGGGEVIEVPISFPRRGIYELGPTQVRTTDPFGFLRFVRTFHTRMEVVVYPPVHDLSELFLGIGNVEAGARGSLGQRGDEFAGLREYRRGDDRRHIHWKSLARTGELFVREFSLQDPRRFTVALDLRHRGLRVPEKEVEDAVSAAASMLTRLDGERQRFRLICTDREGHTTEFGSDEEAYWRAMRLLATVRSDGDKDIGEAVLEERGRLGEGVVLISRAVNDDLVGCVRRLRSTGLSVIVVTIATHTYRPGGMPGAREAGFLRELGAVEAAGAAVCVVRRSGGVARLAGGRG